MTAPIRPQEHPATSALDAAQAALDAARVALQQHAPPPHPFAPRDNTSAMPSPHLPRPHSEGDVDFNYPTPGDIPHAMGHMTSQRRPMGEPQHEADQPMSQDVMHAPIDLHDAAPPTKHVTRRPGPKRVVGPGAGEDNVIDTTEREPGVRAASPNVVPPEPGRPGAARHPDTRDMGRPQHSPEPDEHGRLPALTHADDDDGVDGEIDQGVADLNDSVDRFTKRKRA